MGDCGETPEINAACRWDSFHKSIALAAPAICCTNSLTITLQRQIEMINMPSLLLFENNKQACFMSAQVELQLALYFNTFP